MASAVPNLLSPTCHSEPASAVRNLLFRRLPNVSRFSRRGIPREDMASAVPKLLSPTCHSESASAVRNLLFPPPAPRLVVLARRGTPPEGMASAVPNLLSPACHSESASAVRNLLFPPPAHVSLFLRERAIPRGARCAAAPPWPWMRDVAAPAENGLPATCFLGGWGEGRWNFGLSGSVDRLNRVGGRLITGSLGRPAAGWRLRSEARRRPSRPARGLPQIPWGGSLGAGRWECRSP
jgi:hypothetical protein